MPDKWIAQNKFPALRQQAEAALADELADLSAYSPEELQRFIHELRVQQIELELQNEELRRAQFERELAWEKYAELYHTAPVGYVTLDDNGSIVEFNRTAAHLLHPDPTALMGRALSHFVARQDQDDYHFFLQDMARSDQVQQQQVRLNQPDGFQIYALLEGRRAPDDAVQPNAGDNRFNYRISISDITRLMETEQAYQTLVQNSLQGLTIIQDGKTVFANPAVVAIAGLTPEQFMSLTLADVLENIHVDDRAAVRANVTGATLTPHLEIRYYHPDGQLRWLESHAAAIFYRGRPALQVAFLDITERKQAERYMQESESRQRALLEAIPDAIQRLNRLGTQLEVKLPTGFVSPLPIDQASRNGLKLADYAPQETARDFLAQIEATLDSGQMQIAEYQYTLEGKTYNRETRMVPAGPDEVIAITRDITQRKQMEKTLKTNDRILASMAEGVLVTDESNRIYYTNPAFDVMFGYKPGKLIGRDVSILNADPARTLALFAEEVTVALQTTGSWTGEFENRKKDGSLFVTAATLSRLDMPDKAFRISVQIDITARKQAELELAGLLETVNEQREELQALTGRLSEAQEAERKALARELHDQVGQQLTSLNLNLNTLRARVLAQPPADPRPILSLVDHSLDLVERTTERIQNVMAYLRPPVLDDYGLLAALNWYATELAPQVDFTIQVGGVEPRPRLAASVELALFRVAQEALNNVIKHSQASHVTIQLESNQRVRLIIADDGIGFIPEYRPDQTRVAGWGLLTMNERMEAVGGRCRVKSKPGHGTQIVAEVPR